MKQIILYILIMCLTVLIPTEAKTTFRTAELERLARLLELDADYLTEGYSHPTAKGLRLTVHQSGKSIDHIGLFLFSEEMRQASQSPIFDFLERYFLQLKYPPYQKSMENMIRDDEFKFLMGSLATVDNLLPTDAFSFNYDNRSYMVTWSRNDHPLLSVSFPVEYELISGENKVEADDNLLADIKKTKVVVPTGKPFSKKDYYLSENITNRTYITKGKLVHDARHPAESAANMMLNLQTDGSYNINITQISYGFKKTVVEVPLKQWIAFCQNHGCQLYFGIENMTDSSIVEGVVIAVNIAENYNHVLTVSIPSDMIETKSGTISARLYPYVPTHNVRNMFAAYRKSSPKTFVSQ